MGNLKAVSRTTLAEQVAFQLAEMISDAHWAPGKKLPAESALCETLHVGRSTLREALKSLAFVGMVRVRAGDGTYVAEGSGRLLDRVMAKGLLKTRKDLADVCETRVLLETELAALAAKRATVSDRKRLRALGAELQASLAGEGKPYIEVDVAFHLAIAEASHNSVLQRLLADISGLLIEWIAKSQEFPGGLDSAQEHHTRILNSILNGNAENARREMRHHIETFQKAHKLLVRIPSPADGARVRTERISSRIPSLI